MRNRSVPDARNPPLPPERTEVRSEPVQGLWDLLARLGRTSLLVAVAIYVLCGVALFAYSRWANVDFEYPPGIKLGKRDAPVAAQPEQIDPAVLLVERALGSKPGGGPPLATVFPDQRTANRRNSDLFLSAREIVKIVTVHGRSWLQELEVDPNFKAALSRATIELLLLDPRGSGFNALSASRIRGLERTRGTERLSKATFQTAFEPYRVLAQDPAYGGRLKLRYYSPYPWIRFSIFDNKQATFVLVPFLQPGIEAPIYYTEDPWLIECLNSIFEDFKRASRVLTTPDEYDELWQ